MYLESACFFESGSQRSISLAICLGLDPFFHTIPGLTVLNRGSATGTALQKRVKRLVTFWM